MKSVLSSALHRTAVNFVVRVLLAVAVVVTFTLLLHRN